MAAVRLLSRDEWEQRLHALDCRPFMSRSGLDTGEFWQTQHKRVFIVPVENDGRIRLDDFQIVLNNVAKLKPLDLDD